MRERAPFLRKAKGMEIKPGMEGEPVCFCCGTSDDLAADHVVPRAAGGGKRQLADVPVRSIARACDCSLGYAYKIVSGEYVPHPIHNAPLDRLLDEL